MDPFKPEITPQTLPDLLDKARSLRENKWFDQALSIVKECLEKFPDHAPTNNLMGLLLIDQKKITDAEKYFNTAIAIDPKVPEYYFNLGRILVLKRNFVGAGNAYRQCVLLDPTHTLARYNFANLQEIQGKLPAALKEYQTLLRENPDFYKAHFSLGTVYFRQQKIAQAIASFEQALQFNAVDVATLSNLGVALTKDRQFSKAIEVFNKALKIDPNYVPAMNNLGGTYLELNDRANAKLWLLASLKQEPNAAANWRNLSLSSKFLPNEAHTLEQVNKMLANPNISQIDQMELHFSLGKMFDDLENYDRAYPHYEKANAIAKQFAPFSEDALKEFVAKIIEADSSIPENNFSFDEQGRAQPTFIIGASCSGKSILASVLAQHPDISNCYEVGLYEHMSETYPGILKNLTQVKASAIRESYYNKLKHFAKADAKYLIDTIPDNYLYVGFLATLFPNAKFIDMQRDALDNCWYMFAKYYLANHGYTYDWNTLGAYYQIFEYLVNYWKKKYSSKFIEVNYETLVYHPQQALKPIADHLGISEHAFDLSGLHHFEVGHWRYYEKHLVSLVAALNQTLVVRSEPSNRDKIIAQLSHNAAVYIQQADFSSVKQISNVLIEINPNLYYGYQLLGIVAYQQGEFDQALAWFEKGLQLEPTQALLHQNMAMVLKELGQEEEAKKHLATAESASKVNHVNHPIVFVPNEREFLLSAYAAPVDVVDEFEKRMLMQGKIKEDHSTDSFMTRSWDQYFSDLSFGRYRGYHMRAWHYLYKNIALIEHIMSLQQPLVRILDLGCSSGYFRRFLEGNIDPQDRRRFFYWGLDVRADCLQKALKDVDDIESGAPGNTVPSSFVIQDTQFGLPYKDDVFDIVVNFEMLKYLPIEQGKKLLHDVHRVMNKKGVFVLSTTYNSNQPGFMQEVPFERIEKMLVDSGFQILQRRGSQVQFSFLKANLAERHKAMVEDLLKVHPPEMVGAMIAPLYPQLSEQVTFISKKIN